MTKLISDKAQVETSNKVKDIFRNYHIGDWQSEPYQQQQNPAERHWQNVKRLANTLLDNTGAPASLWFLALQHACYIHNHLAHKLLHNYTPLYLLTGDTPDICPLLHYDWYEPVYYKITQKASFPSESNEKSGRIVGISESVGHSLTYKVLTDDTNKIVHRSIIHFANDQQNVNCQALNTNDDNPTPVIMSRIDEPINKPENIPDTSLDPNVFIDPEELISRTFLIPQEDEQKFRARIVETIRDHQENIVNSSAHIKFWCSMNDDSYQDILTYQQVMDYLDTDEDNPIFWKFKGIVGHQGPLAQNHSDQQGSSYNVRIEWENGEITDEPLDVLAIDDPVVCTTYADKHNLLELPGQK